MQSSTTPQSNLALESVVTRTVASARLLIGLVQGGLLYWLYHAVQTGMWPATATYLFAPLLLLGLLLPILAISSLGHLARGQLVRWIGVAALVIAALAFHDVWRAPDQVGFWFGSNPHSRARYPSGVLLAFLVAGLFIAHAMVLAGAHDKRRFASYPTYFETAWKLYIQLQFSALFVCVLWLVLQFGAVLFTLVRLDFLERLLRESWFAIPVTAFAFSCAFHITDVRAAIVRGIRTLLLVLLSWLLPVIVLIVAGFLLSLPGTGLTPLWATRHATAVLLGAAALLVILINAAFQNGEAAAGVARVIRFSARGAALCLLPLVAIGIYALTLRVRQYGWTGDRIDSAACLFVASCYALGYAWAGMRRSGWLAPIAGVNVACALVVLAVLLYLFSPAGDPARLSVNDQLARLEAGKVSAEKFDYDYLRFQGVRYGRAALEQLQARTQGENAALIREKATAALKKQNRWQSAPQASEPADLRANIIAWPPGNSVPASLLQQKWSAEKYAWQLPLCLKLRDRRCDAYAIDFDGDGKPEWLLTDRKTYAQAVILAEGEGGRWAITGFLPHGLGTCAALQGKLQAGDYRLVPAPLKDIEIDGQRLAVERPQSANRLRCKPATASR